jgi:hypothetical protein
MMRNRLLKTLTLSTLLASSSLLANDSVINSMGLNLGVVNSDSDQKNTNGAIIFGNEPDSSFNQLELYLTLNPLTETCKEYNMKPYISYTYSSNSDLKHQYLLLGVNKYYTPSNIDLELYMGALLGYGQIDWKYDPLNNSFNKNVDANSFIGGIQLGVKYPLSEKLSLNLNGKYLFHSYETDLKTTNATAVIEHDRTSSFSLGLEYRF